MNTGMRRGALAMTMAMVMVVLSAWVAIAANDGPETRFAFVARGDNPIDALGSAPIAGRLDAPVLLTRSDALGDAARQGLIDASPDVVILAGGEGALSQQVHDDIQSAVPRAVVRRVAGGDRFDTAVALAALIREYQPAFAYDLATDGTEFVDTNAYGIACDPGDVLTGISDTGEPVCAEDVDTDTNVFGAACTNQVLAGFDGSGSPICVDDAVDGGDAATLGAIDADGFVKSSTICLNSVVFGSDATGLPTCQQVASSQVQNNSLTAADLAADSVGSSEIAAAAVGASELGTNSVRVGDLALVFVTDTVNLFGNVNAGACSTYFGTNATGAVAPNRAVAVDTQLASGGVNPGWVVEGTTGGAANAAEIRVCNQTGATADPPNLRFTLLVFGT